MAIEGQGRVGWKPAPPTIWTGLLAYYTADNTPNDAKGTANGTLTNGATYATGKINNGFSFDGINDTITLSNTATKFSSSMPFSYNVWVKVSTYSGLQFIYIDATYIYGTGIAIWGGGVALTIGDVNGSYQSSVVPPLNTWTMLTVTYNGTVNQANNLLFYKNGVLAQGMNLYGAFDKPGAANQQIGSGGYRGYLQGNIDELGIWNKTLTASEVTELYNAGAGKQYN